MLGELTIKRAVRPKSDDADSMRANGVSERPIANPYLDEFRGLFGKDNPDFAEVASLYPDRHRRRNDLCAKYAWAIPNEAALREIARHGPIIEIGAGGGYWARLLRQMGVAILPFDNRSSHQEVSAKQWVSVKRGDDRQAALHSDHSLFLCWPPYDTDMAERAIRQYCGSTVLYVGEKYGCTGTEACEDLLCEEWGEVAAVTIPQWPAIHDCLRTFTRKP